MSREQTETIDFIADSPHHEGFDLIVLESGDITDEIERYTLLLEKLRTYASYVALGDFKEAFPEADAKEVRIVVICATPANEAMLQISAIKPRDMPYLRFPVVFTSKEEYLSETIGGSLQGLQFFWWIAEVPALHTGGTGWGAAPVAVAGVHDAINRKATDHFHYFGGATLQAEFVDDLH